MVGFKHCGLQVVLLCASWFASVIYLQLFFFFPFFFFFFESGKGQNTVGIFTNKGMHLLSLGLFFFFFFLFFFGVFSHDQP